MHTGRLQAPARPHRHAAAVVSDSRSKHDGGGQWAASSMAGPAGSGNAGSAAAAATTPAAAPSQPPANAASLGLLGLLPLLVLAALGVSLALGRPALLAAWPTCTHLVEEEGTSTTSGSPAPPLHVPVFLTQDSDLAALSALKRAREAYRTELVVRMKALERMALDRIPEWRGHSRRPLLTAALQDRVWEGDEGLRARVPECWEANERVLDRLLRLPEVTVGLPMKEDPPLSSPLPVEGEEQEEEEAPQQPASGDTGSSGSSGSTKGYNDGVQVLTHLLRDWAEEGHELRRRTYGPILRAVGRLFPQQGARILVPGAGLGRLAFVLAYGGGGGGGHRVTALDVSAVMVAATASVLRLVLSPEEEEEEEQERAVLRLYPFVHDPLINQRSHAARYREVTCPDLEARRQAERARRNHHQSSSLSLEIGDLLALADAQPGAYDAVATCFFVDTGKHPLDYLWAIHKLLRPGGYWVNLGPLNYHQTLLDGAVQLTLEELDFAAAEMGLVPQREWDLAPEPCAYRPEPFPADAGAGGSAFLRSDVYVPAFSVYRKEEG